MLVSIERTKINKDLKNQVTSSLILAPHRRQTATNIKLHEDGIFSKRIFGNFKKCDCGSLTSEGFCDNCNTRVISIKNMPNFYVDLTIKVAAPFADYKNSGINPLDCESILKYEKFLYGDEITQLNEENENDFDQSIIKIGLDALQYLGVKNEWIEENTVDFLSVPHPIYRPMIIDDRDTPYITGINNLYSNIIKNINNAIEMHTIAKNRPLFLMLEYKTISKLHRDIISALFDELQEVKYSILKSEIISHPISGAARATLINRHDVHEDVLLVGDTLVETLYPFLYKKYEGDMTKINKELVDGGAMMLLNRPPTICHLSTVSMKPRIASVYPFGHTSGTDGCLLHNEDYVNKFPYKIGLFKDVEGDIEKFGQGSDKNGEYDGIDNVGIRCYGVNLIMADGLGADTDGDVLLGIALYSQKAKEQAEQLLPSRAYMNYANGTIRNHIIEDFIFADIS